MHDCNIGLSPKVSDGLKATPPWTKQSRAKSAVWQLRFGGLFPLTSVALHLRSESFSYVLNGKHVLAVVVKFNVVAAAQPSNI